MLKVKEGDLDKLGLLFERYHRRLFHFFYRMTNRRDVSEDLVQGVFERILKYRNTYSNNGSFKTWIFQIARNLQIDHYKRSRDSEKLDDYLDWNKLAAEDDNIEADSRQHRKENLKLLKKAINRLDPKKKQTLILSRFEGFKYKEIAEIMNCSESSVKVRVFRAVQELEVIMKELKQTYND